MINKIMNATFFLIITFVNLNAELLSRNVVDRMINKGNLSTEQVFNLIYENDYWMSKESASGSGSTIATTQTIRKYLPILLEEIEVKTLLDAPCGDFNWMKTVELPIEQYVGVDIVPELVKINQKKYGNNQRKFMYRNLITDALPCVDLILCRDCLQHLSFEDALQVLNNFKVSGSKYLLVSTNIGTTLNRQIKTGECSEYNLQLPPFNFPKPLLLIEESSAESTARSFKKSLGLWMLKDIIKS